MYFLSTSHLCKIINCFKASTVALCISLIFFFGPYTKQMFSLIMKKFQFVSTQLPETKQRTLGNSPNKDTVDKPVQTIMAYLSSGCCLS